MNIMIIDAEGILHPSLISSAKEQLFEALIQFGHRFEGATMHVSVDDDLERVRCSINANDSCSEIISVHLSNPSAEAAIELAITALCNKIQKAVNPGIGVSLGSIRDWLAKQCLPAKPFFSSENQSVSS